MAGRSGAESDGQPLGVSADHLEEALSDLLATPERDDPSGTGRRLTWALRRSSTSAGRGFAEGADGARHHGGVQSLELMLDAPAEAALRRQWDLLADAGLPSLTRHTSPSNRPHITLDARDAMPEDEGGLVAVAGRLPVPVRIGAALLFRTRGTWVLARHVVVNRELLDLHAHAHDVLGPGGSPLSATGQWIPHVTMARWLDDAQVTQAMGVLGPENPVEATGVRLRRWDSERRETWYVDP